MGGKDEPPLVMGRGDIKRPRPLALLFCMLLENTSGVPVVMAHTHASLLRHNSDILKDKEYYLDTYRGYRDYMCVKQWVKTTFSVTVSRC